MKAFFLLTLFTTSSWAAPLTLADWMKSNCPTCSVNPGDELTVPYPSGMVRIRVIEVQRRKIRLGFLRVQDQNGTYRIFYNVDENTDGRNEDAKLLCAGLGSGWQPSEVKYNIVYKNQVGSPPTPDYETFTILECKKGFNISLPPLPGPTFNVKINVNNKDRESGKEGIFIQENVTIPMTLNPQSTSPR